MNQEQLLAKRDELVREYHLGELELYRTPKTPRGLAKWVALFLLLELVIAALLLGSLFISSRHALDLSLVASIAPPIVLTNLFGGCIACVFIYLKDRTSVYVYTSGLVCLSRSGGRVVHWKEIRKVWIERGENSSTLFVELNDYTRIRFPEFSSRGSANYKELQQFIEGKMVPAQ